MLTQPKWLLACLVSYQPSSAFLIKYVMLEPWAAVKHHDSRQNMNVQLLWAFLLNHEDELSRNDQFQKELCSHTEQSLLPDRPVAEDQTFTELQSSDSLQVLLSLSLDSSVKVAALLQCLGLTASTSEFSPWHSEETWMFCVPVWQLVVSSSPSRLEPYEVLDSDKLSSGDFSLVLAILLTTLLNYF